MPATLRTVASGGAQHPIQMLVQAQVQSVLNSGVADLAGGHFLVEQANTPGMSVDVRQGFAVIRNSDGSVVYPVELSGADGSVAIDANGSGNSRIDAIILYIDLGASPVSGVTNVAKLGKVNGTPAGSPVAPDDSAIAAVIGASNPFLRLANVTVASAATSIVDANIANARVMPRFAFGGGVQLQKVTAAPATPGTDKTLLYVNTNELLAIKGDGGTETLVKTDANWINDTDGATITFNLALGAKHRVTLGGNRTLALSNVPSGKEFILRLKQDGTGSRTVTWFAGISWVDGTVPTLTTTINKTDVFGFIQTGANTYDGFVIGQNI